MISRRVKENDLKKRQFMFGVLTIFAVINTGVNLAIDFLINSEITWSLYPVYSVIFVWLLCVPMLFKYDRLAVWIGMFSTILIPYLFLMDMVFPEQSWFMPIALPISLLTILFLWFCYSIYVIYFIRKKKREGQVK